MSDDWHKYQAPVYAAANAAQKRNRLEMIALVSRQFVFDAGMSFYCKVCGSRQQSMIPAPHFDHRPECPLHGLQEEIKKSGGEWPKCTEELTWTPPEDLASSEEAEFERLKKKLGK